MSISLTIAVPCFNSEEYMGTSIDSLLKEWAPDVEVVIVNDGSKDGTARIADEYVQRYPDRVRAVHKVNGGHGSAINAGLEVARGAYFKVLDSDDWLDEDAYRRTLDLIRGWIANESAVDLLITNFVYEKQGKRNKQSVNYRRALPRNRTLGWHQVRSFLPWQYMLMHSMIYRTELLRECQLQVPEHSFYVDNYFAFVPLPHVQSLYYLDVDLYRYFIGRDDQSVNEKVMISRIDQQININLKLVEALSGARKVGLPYRLERYMIDYVNLISTVSSTLLVREGSDVSVRKKGELWQAIDAIDAELSLEMRARALGKIVSADGPASERTIRAGYHVSRLVVGFN